MLCRPTFVTALVTLGMAVGCAPPSAPLRPVTAVEVQGVVHRTGSFMGAGGVALFEQSWQPVGAPRAVLVVHHGLKDHSTRYGEFAARMVAQGFAVYAYDMRGHGRSAGQRATLDDFDDLVADLGTFMDRVRLQQPAVPVFLLGHSVGGCVVTLYTLQRRPSLAGLVVLAPALRIDRMPIEAAATPLAGALAPNFPVVNTPDEDFSRSPEVVQEMVVDPLVYHSVGPARTAAALLDAIGTVWSLADTLDVPLLGVHGTADRLTDPRGTAELVRRARNPDHTLVLYRGLVHDLIHEPEREQVMSDLQQWLLARVPPGSTGEVRHP